MTIAIKYGDRETRSNLRRFFDVRDIGLDAERPIDV